MDNSPSTDPRNQLNQNEGINLPRASWVAIIYLVIAISSFGLGIILAASYPYWQIFIMLITATISTACDIVVVVLIRRGRARPALWLMYWSGLIAIPINSFLIPNVAAFLVPMVLVIGFVDIYLLFPRPWRRFAPLGPILAAALMLLVETLNPPFRYTLSVLPTATSFGPIMLAVLVAGILALAIQQRLILARFLANISVAWKIILMAAVLFLGMLGITATAYQGVQSLRYQFSNIYDFMLIPITSIDTADTSLTDAQYQIAQLLRTDILSEDRTLDINHLLSDNQSAQDIFTRYDKEWVTTTSPDFTQALQSAGKIGLQHEEVATLAALHSAMADYQTALTPYLDSVRAGSPDAALADNAARKLENVHTQLRQLIDINNEFADFSNAQAQAAFSQAILSGAIVLGISLFLGLFISSLIAISINSRLGELTRSAAAMQAGDLDQPVAVAGRDEVALLGSALNKMAAQLRELFTGLEQRVAAATRNLTLAAEVGRNVTRVHDLDILLKEAADLIRQRFDLYYTQVYLLDPTGRQLVLRAGTGEAGGQLMARRHSLTVDLASLNGTAVIERRAVIVEDTGTSQTHHPNPLLPDTRSEMVVPLLVGERVVGTLDMQSKQAGALNKESLDAFEALAGQLAIAIENASLIAEAQTARATVEAQSRHLVHEGWQEFLNAIQHSERIGYTYDLEKVSPFDEPLLADPDSRALIAAIPVANEPVGTFKFVSEQTWSEEDAALVSIIARQLGQQVENLRLLAQADQYRAETEQALRRMTLQGWESQLADHPDAKAGYLYDRNRVSPLSSADGNDPQPIATRVLEIAGEEIGELSVGSTNVTQEEIDELLSTVGDQLSARVENLRLLSQSQTALAQSEKLFTASRRLTEAADLQGLVAGVVESLAIPVVNRALLGVFEYDEKGEFLSMTTVANWWNGTGTEATAIGTRYPVEVFKTISLFASTTPVFSNDILNDPRVDAATLALVERLNLRALAVLPLFAGSRQTGVLMLEAESPHNFSQDETRLFTSLAPQVATVLENRRQYERAQRQAERETLLNAINQKIQSATSVEAVLQIAARELGRALGAPLTIAQLGTNGKK